MPLASVSNSLEKFLTEVFTNVFASFRLAGGCRVYYLAKRITTDFCPFLEEK
jgi:hypothetical protein